MNNRPRAACAVIAAAVPIIGVGVQAQQCLANGWCYAYTGNNGSESYVRVLKRDWPYVTYVNRVVGVKVQATLTAIMDCTSAKYRWTNESTWNDVLPGAKGETVMLIVCR